METCQFILHANSFKLNESKTVSLNFHTTMSSSWLLLFNPYIHNTSPYFFCLSGRDAVHTVFAIFFSLFYSHFEFCHISQMKNWIMIGIWKWTKFFVVRYFGHFDLNSIQCEINNHLIITVSVPVLNEEFFSVPICCHYQIVINTMNVNFVHFSHINSFPIFILVFRERICVSNTKKCFHVVTTCDYCVLYTVYQIGVLWRWIDGCRRIINSKLVRTRLLGFILSIALPKHAYHYYYVIANVVFLFWDTNKRIWCLCHDSK